MEKIKKIPFYLADMILDAKYPMFDRKTNRIFWTKAAFAVILYGKVVAVDVINKKDWNQYNHRYAVNKNKIKTVEYYNL